MFFIIGTKYITWGSELTAQPMRCGQCNTVAPFVIKKGMNFLTLFFIIPTIPLSGTKTLVECPTCKAKYQQS